MNKTQNGSVFDALLLIAAAILAASGGQLTEADQLPSVPKLL